jgi:hypothetical protein
MPYPAFEILSLSSLYDEETMREAAQPLPSTHQK